jgi:hypothetical protein
VGGFSKTASIRQPSISIAPKRNPGVMKAHMTPPPRALLLKHDTISLTFKFVPMMQCPPSCTCAGSTISGCYPSQRVLHSASTSVVSQAQRRTFDPQPFPTLLIDVLTCPRTGQKQGNGACNPGQVRGL